MDLHQRLFYAELWWNISYFWQFCTLPGGTNVPCMEVPHKSSLQFYNAPTTKDASCINLSIAKEQLKGKLTVVPIKNPDDHEMLKVFREYFFLLDQLVVKYYSITSVWPLI